MKQAQDFYALDELLPLLDQAPNLHIVLACEVGKPEVEIRDRLSFVSGTVVDALGERASMLVDRDIYAAGPPVMLRALMRDLDRSGVAKARVHVDSFSV